MQYAKLKPVQGTKQNTAPPADKTVTTNVPAAVPLEEQKWEGQTVDLNYSVVPEEKEAVLENLKKAGDDTLKRFGLDTQGVDPEPYPGQ